MKKFLILLSIVLPSEGFSSSKSGKCAKFLMGDLPRISSNKLLKVRTLNEFQRDNGKEKDAWQLGWGRKHEYVKIGKARLGNKDVMLKAISQNGNEFAIVVELNQNNIGPKILGTIKRSNIRWFVHEYVVGQLYKPFFDGDDIEADDGSGYNVNPIFPGSVAVTDRTIADVNHTFDVLTKLEVSAVDAQFIVTPDSRAVLIDFEFFSRRGDAAIFNEKLRRVFIEGLTASSTERERILNQRYKYRSFVP